MTHRPTVPATSSFDDLSPDETQLTGRWLESAQGNTDDAVETRIKWLVANRLVALGRSTDGWDWLFRDPRDGRLWELTFPLGSLHGSGPRTLRVVSTDDASAGYGI
jgi:hypothetical protein